MTYFITGKSGKENVILYIGNIGFLEEKCIISVVFLVYVVMTEYKILLFFYRILL